MAIRIRAGVATETRTWNVVVTLPYYTSDDWYGDAKTLQGNGLHAAIRSRIREVAPMAYIHGYVLLKPGEDDRPDTPVGG